MRTGWPLRVSRSLPRTCSVERWHRRPKVRNDSSARPKAPTPTRRSSRSRSLRSTTSRCVSARRLRWVLGFSFGAAYATLIPAERERLVASVVYYGVYTGPHVEQSSAAVQGHFAETDQFESDEGIAELEGSLRSAGREVTIHRYPGTGHWFAEPSRDAYVPEAADLAFERTVAFLQTHLVTEEPGV
jgi:dienelactone hydrolase